MAELDAEGVGLLAVRLGLVPIDPMQEALEELGDRHGNSMEFLRILERKGHLTPWQSQKLLKGDTEGYFLGGYRLLYKIASGSFGRVYRAEDPGTGTVVAIKVLRNRWTEDPKNIGLFEREGKVGMTMKHPNIVEILAVKCDPKTKQFYIVMEFVEGGNLRDFLRIRKKLEPIEAIRILEDAAAGLAYSYSQGVSHRDMKLTNVLISSQGRAKLVDFGLAGLSQNLSKKDKDEGQVDRTVDYAGLEKATNATHGDIRSDIYFLGCVAYELLTGRSPLEKTKNPHERMRSARFQKVPPMRPEDVKAPPSVFRLVETMMSLDLSQRYQTPSQLLEAIRNVRRDLEGAASTASKNGGRSLFIVEKDVRLQEALRDRFKEAGYRVLLSGDPVRALDRYRQQPYDSLIVDAGTVDEEGLFLFDRILNEAQNQERSCAGSLILSEHQKDWAGKVKSRPTAAVLVRPVTVKQLKRELEKLLGAEEEN
jgi:serine/threonine protein kinase